MSKSSGGTRGASGGAGGGNNIVVTIEEWQMRQEGALIKYEKIRSVKAPKSIHQEIVKEGLVFNTRRNVLSRTYRGDERWIAASEKVMDDRGRWLIGDYEKVKTKERTETIKIRKGEDWWEKLQKYKKNTEIDVVW